MIGIVATFAVKPGQAAAFEAAIASFVAQVRAFEPGTTLYAFFKSRRAADTYVMMEQYQSQAALDAHNASAHLQALLPIVGPMLAGAPDVHELDAV
jgi:quinol monooxygenase YgiN